MLRESTDEAAALSESDPTEARIKGLAHFVRMECHGAQTSAPLSTHLSIECRCTAPQIETPICTRRTTTHQFIWRQQQHTCGAVGGSSMECGVGGQPHKTPHFHPRHWHPPSRNGSSKNSVSPPVGSGFFPGGRIVHFSKNFSRGLNV